MFTSDSRRFSVLLIFVMSMAINNPTPIGFPPPDIKLRDWLTATTSDRDDVQRRLHAFVYSVLVVTQRELETISEEQSDYLPSADWITC